MNLDFSPAISQLQEMLNSAIASLPNLVVALVVFVLFVFAARGIGALVRGVANRYRRPKHVGLVFGRLTRWVVLFIGGLVTAVILFPNFTPARMIEFLGISSVAIGFAFRDILQNFLAGILLLLTEPFRIGDQIVINDFEGMVEDIQTRATFIKTYDGRRIVIPNANLFTSAVTVNTAHEKRRLQYDIGIGYGDDIAHAKRILLDTVHAVPEVLDDPAPDAIVVKLADSSVNIRLRWWVQPPRQFDMLNSQDIVLEKVVDALLSAGFDLPFPTQQILFHDQTEESDGDRSRQREGWPAGQGETPRPARIVDALRDLKKSRSAALKLKPNEEAGG